MTVSEAVVVVVAPGAVVVVVVVQIHITLHHIIQYVQSWAYVTKGDVGNGSTSRELWSGPHLMPKTRIQQKKVYPTAP